MGSVTPTLSSLFVEDPRCDTRLAPARFEGVAHRWGVASREPAARAGAGYRPTRQAGDYPALRRRVADRLGHVGRTTLARAFVQGTRGNCQEGRRASHC